MYDFSHYYVIINVVVVVPVVDLVPVMKNELARTDRK